jgi:hypothetical protein
MITLEELKTAIDDMYEQLNQDRISDWPVSELEIYINGEWYRITAELTK